MKVLRISLACLSISLISPYAIAQEENKHDAEEASSNVCVNSRTIRNFDAFTDEHIFIEESGKKYFLFTMRGRCFGLRNSFGIAIKDTTSRVCSKGFGEVSYRDNSNRVSSCRIDTIEAIESKEDAKALVEKRKKDENQSE